MEKDWQKILTPYEQAVNELKFKLRACRKQFKDLRSHSPIEFVRGRVKEPRSIEEKMQRRQIAWENLTEEMEDLAGLRIVCQFTDDIYQVVEMLRARDDMEIIAERDYVKNIKPSGYRSYHVIINYPVQLITGTKTIKVEIQVRTLAMNFWATIEHSLNYKYQGEIPEHVARRLKTSAEVTILLDEEMTNIRDEVCFDAADADIACAHKMPPAPQLKTK